MPDYACPPEHKHATNGTCYAVHRCRCDDCRTGRAEHASARRREQAYGRYDHGLVDAAPVRKHVEYLQAHGMGWKRIGVVSGVGSTGVSTLVYGRKGPADDPRRGEVLQRTSRVKAEKILAVRPDLQALSGGALIPSRGTQRRVQALVARGWSQAKIGALVDVTPGNFWRVMKADSVTAKFALTVMAVYDRLWNTPPPNEEWRDRIAFSRSLNYAAERRWVAPFGWDDIDLDVTPPLPDDADGVDDVAVELAMSGADVRLSKGERRVAVERLWSARFSDARIAERLRFTERTALRIRQELDLPAFKPDEIVTVRAA